MIIRQEMKKDYDCVYKLVKESFAFAEHTDGNEHELLLMLRECTEFIQQLSLVAEQDGTIVGHIMFTKALVGNRTELILAPLSIMPQYQRQGIGAALIKEGHKIAKELGYEYCVLIGSENYYSRFGYVESTTIGIIGTDGIPPKNFMAIKLRSDASAISGNVTYSKAFKE